MAFCKNHDHIYFDTLCRTKKAESVLSLIHATYQAKLNKGNKEDIAKHLVNAYELFKFDAGSYTGETSQFESQYTIGHELGIWKNSDLDLTDTALQVAKNIITIKEYFDIFFLNYIQPIDGKIVHPLYLVLNYAKQNQLTQITKSDLNDIFSFASKPEKNEINGLFNMLIGSNYFEQKNSTTLLITTNVSETLEKCNLSLVEEQYEVVKEKFKDLEAYLDYLLSTGRDTALSNTEWIISANPSTYNHQSSFAKFGAIEWHQSANFSVGDIAYIYTGRPFQKITNVVRVTKINIPLEEREIDDNEFWIGDKGAASETYVKLELIKTIDDDRLSLESLKQHGLNAPPQRPIKVNDELHEYISFVLNGEIRNNIVGYNKIYYGIPGCGKSYHIEHTDLKDADKDRDVFRTTFYLDYSNSDFIGQIYPQVEKGEDGKDRVTYKRIPGPFTNALARAYSEPNKMIYLVIEEINRGNAAAIFGDLFQLLDRLSEEWNGRYPGDSEYPINNEFIEGYLKEKNIKIPYGQNKIFVPKNMTILATMNTSDQNVFPLDTAFKRRWDRERVVVDWKDVDDEFKSMYIPFTDHTWEEFASTVNKKMVTSGEEGMVLEDKQLGPYFINKDMLVVEIERKETTQQNKDRLRKFVNNVIDYLYNDVTKFDHAILFENNPTNYDDVYDAIIKYENNAFVGDIDLGLNVFDHDDIVKSDVEDDNGEED